MSVPPLRAATRKSLLALTQSQLTTEALKKKTSHPSVLVTFTTQGDQQTEKPLWQLEGSDFFTKELDRALIDNKADFAIHSYKDLGSVRPQGIYLGAITKRRFPHDLLLLKRETAQNIHQLSSLTIGTSSPRRQVNLASFEKLWGEEAKKLKTIPIRGNINTRLEKIHKGECDAIILALAGLERLAQGEDSQKELESLLRGLTFFVLPTSLFPPAASQGALGLECREEDQKTRDILHALHDSISAEEITRERQAFQAYGGGCHLAVGVHVRKWREYFLHWHLGQTDHTKIQKRVIEGRAPLSTPFESLFIGLPERKKESLIEPSNQTKIIFDQVMEQSPLHPDQRPSGHVFVTSSYCLHALENSPQSLWASGSKTLAKLFQKGFWINGSADGLGHSEISLFQSSKALKIMIGDAPWQVLSHSGAQSDVGELIPTYERKMKTMNEAQKKHLEKVQAFFWTSRDQYHAYKQICPSITKAFHGAGLGKTFDLLSQEGVKLTPFFDQHDFLDYTLKRS